MPEPMTLSNAEFRALLKLASDSIKQRRQYIELREDINRLLRQIDHYASKATAEPDAYGVCKDAENFKQIAADLRYLFEPKRTLTLSEQLLKDDTFAERKAAFERIHAERAYDQAELANKMVEFMFDNKQAIKSDHVTAQNVGDYFIDNYGVLWKMESYVDQPQATFARADDPSNKTSVVLGSIVHDAMSLRRLIVRPDPKFSDKEK